MRNIFYLIERIPRPLGRGILSIKKESFRRCTNLLNKADKTIDDTKFGNFLSKVFKFKIDYENTSLIERTEKAGEKKLIHAFKVEGNCFGKLIGKSLLRIPLLSVIVLSILEIPKIVKTFFDKENADNGLKAGIKQIAKSGIYVASILSNIGILGALFASFGPAGSLVGMGIGSVTGSIISRKANTVIDNLY